MEKFRFANLCSFTGKWNGVSVNVPHSLDICLFVSYTLRIFFSFELYISAFEDLLLVVTVDLFALHSIPLRYI